MFFAAERELQQKRRRKSEELVGRLTFTEDAGVSIGAPKSPKSPMRPLDAVYPGFTSTRLGDVLRIVTDIEVDDRKPPLKKQKLHDEFPDHEHRESQSPLQIKSKNLARSPQSYDELVKVFPQLKTILVEQQNKMESRKISDQYIREIEKPKAILSHPSRADPEPKKDEAVTWNPNLTVDSSKPQEPPPLPTGISGAVPANVGGGLLSGIDDLFGSPKKKTRSKRR